MKFIWVVGLFLLPAWCIATPGKPVLTKEGLLSGIVLNINGVRATAAIMFPSSAEPSGWASFCFRMYIMYNAKNTPLMIASMLPR